MLEKIKSWYLWANLYQFLIVLDQLANCVLGIIVSLFNWNHRIWADETLSAYLWRQHEYWYINIFRVLVDSIFFIFTWKWNHCEESFKSEQEAAHLPEEER